jgi:glutamate-1-semialdehyde 2,1-aminomutase
MPYFRNGGEGGYSHHSRWVAECIKRGAYLLPYHNNFVSVAHTDEDLERTWAIADQAFAALPLPESVASG